MPNFTCFNCDILFANAEIQRQHYKTDWHRYNLKRRVAQLPPVTAEQYQCRVLEMRSASEKALEEQHMSIYCNACRKQFRNQKAHDNHLTSKKHKENLTRFEQKHIGDDNTEITTKSVFAPRQHPASAAAAAGKDKYASVEKKETVMIVDGATDDDFEVIEDEELDSDEWVKIGENLLTEKDCLFCTHTSENIVENLKHMSVAHSFFIPDIEYCTDLDGLLYYLGEKIANYYICLWCNDRGKTFYTLDAVRKHMLDKGHCQMLHEGIALAEYADYYDYSSSYPDNETCMDIDSEVVPDLLDGDEYQLVLPSGAVIGHRSLLRYYKQRLNHGRALIPKKSDRKLHKVLSEYRAHRWRATQQQAAARKTLDIHLMKRVQSRFGSGR